MNRWKRIFCLMLCISLFVMLFASSMLSVLGCHHSCQGEDCVVCTEVSTWKRNLAASVICRAVSFCSQPMIYINGISAASDIIPATDTLLALGVLLII